MLGIKKSITIRGLTEETVEALKWLAESRDRTMEGEVRTALKAWIESGQSANVENTNQTPQRFVETAERINLALKLASLTSSPSGAEKKKGFTGAHLAEGIGESYEQPVYDWLSGKSEPSFSELERIADWCAVDPDWMKTGTGTPYTVENIRVPEHPFYGAFWLLKMREEEPIPKVKRLHFLRREGPRGELMIVRQYDNGFDVYGTPYVVSDDTGSGGRASLESLCKIWRVLYAIYTSKPAGKFSGLLITGHIVRDEIWDQLSSGYENPDYLIRKFGGNTPWWEDIWDNSMLAKHTEDSYWPGYLSLASSLQSSIQKDDPELSKKVTDLKYADLEKFFAVAREQ